MLSIKRVCENENDQINSIMSPVNRDGKDKMSGSIKSLNKKKEASGS
jgi:hypothetical protein